MTKLTAEQSKMVLDMMNAPPMTVSMLIEVLQEIEREHGDLPVRLNDESELREVCAYDADGDARGKRTEVVLHGVR